MKSDVGAWYVDVCSPPDVRAKVGTGRYTRNITQVLAGPSSLSHGDNSTVRRGVDDDGRECARVYFKTRKRAARYSVISKERLANLAPDGADEVEIADPAFDDEYRWPMYRGLRLDPSFYEDLGTADDDDEEDPPDHPAVRYRNSAPRNRRTKMKPGYEPSCADLPDMLTALVFGPELMPETETLDMRWHISACRQCHAVVAAGHKNLTKFCPKLRLLAMALHKTGHLTTTDPEALRYIGRMPMSEARQIIKHAASGRCAMCKLWLPRLKAEKH